MIEIKFIKDIEILSAKFKLVWEKNNDGGSFSWASAEIKIGIKSVKTDPLYTFSVISHELMELILTGMGGRFENGRTHDNFLFNFDHQTFENAIQVHAQAISKFIK